MQLLGIVQRVADALVIAQARVGCQVGKGDALKVRQRLLRLTNTCGFARNSGTKCRSADFTTFEMTLSLKSQRYSTPSSLRCTRTSR